MQAHQPLSCPAFQPHITLASVPAEEAPPREVVASYIAELRLPFQVRLKALRTGDTKWTGVYLVVEPSAELLALRRLIYEKLGREEPPVEEKKFPHLSLYYIDDGERERVREALVSTGQVVEDDGGVKVKVGEDGVEWMDVLEGVEILVMDCTGAVEDWEKWL
jgi:2',3'-cyclic-nucleotide 3'-phosphodiesterase